MPTRDLILEYYRSLGQKNDHWQSLYSEDAVFSDASRTLEARGRDAVLKSFVPFLKRLESVKIKQMIVEGPAACAIIGYEYVNPRGEKLNQDVAEVWKVEDEKLAALTIYFDLTAYRAFMRA